MDSEKQTTPIVEAWLKGTSDSPYGTEMGVGRVRSRVRQTRQGSRWWRLPSFQRGTTPAPSMSDTEFQPTSIPASNGHTPTIFGTVLGVMGIAAFANIVFLPLFGWKAYSLSRGPRSPGLDQ